MSSFKNNLKKWRPQLLILLCMLGTASLFQNCSDKVSFSKMTDEGAGGALALSPNGLLTINNGALYTNNISVLLGIAADNAVEMQIINENCVPGVSNLDVFEPVTDAKSWLLADADGSALVYLKLRSENQKLSGCIAANITLDRRIPTISFENVPDKIMAVKTADVDVKAMDEISGVDKLLCKKTGQATFTDCTTHLVITDANEGGNSVAYYAVDKAGNKSTTIEYSWIVDTTAPSVAITDPKPAAMIAINSTLVYFKGDDGVGSGIAGYKCKLDNSDLPNCVSPSVLNNLADGNHQFVVWAIDKAGLVSAPASHSFSVDTQASGAFQILGITGGADVKVDNYLTAATTSPVIKGSPSAGAQSYTAAIYNEANTVMFCSGAFGVLAEKALSACNLTENTKYVVRLTALRNGIETKAPNFVFMYDKSGPVIAITSVVTDNTAKTATIKFTITDAGSGVAAAKCYRTKGPDVREDNCYNQTTITYNNLISGLYSFYITAADNAANTSQSNTMTFSLQEIVCDPFAQTTSSECPKGLRANLFYAPASERVVTTTVGDLNNQLNAKYSTVKKLIDLGVKSNALVYLPYLDVPYRKFTEGFSTTENALINDDSGRKLDEWFALEMTGVAKLGAYDAEGYYQFLIVSDDGSNLFLGTKASSGAITYDATAHINNDGVHATKVGCAVKNVEVYMSASTRLPIKLQYYQGPRMEIAMSLYWRKVPAKGSELGTQCGTPSSSDQNTWYGSVSDIGRYQKILNDGFKPLKIDNLVDGVN